MSCRDDDDDGWMMTYSILTSQCNYRETRKGLKSRRFDMIRRELGECSFNPSPVPVPHTNIYSSVYHKDTYTIHMFIYIHIYIQIKS